jgi:dihydrofolate synthase/folylpolyglutamate synthase
MPAPVTAPTRVPGPLSRPVLDYSDIHALLLSRVRKDPRPYAERSHLAGRVLRELLDRSGVSLDHLRFLHVAGSKGKGSVALLTENLLLAGGEATGTYTSPHLLRWNERVRVGGAAVSDRTLAAALDTLRPHVAALDAESDDLAPTFFDLITAAALLILARSECRSAILETGLGGRFDATNVVRPTACCVTSIELEHVDKLGPTLADVAWHKAGIIKAGVPVVTGDLCPEARDVVAARVAEVGACELRLGRDWELDRECRADGSQAVCVRLGMRPADELRFELPWPGRHMAVNAGLALMLCRSAGHTVQGATLHRCELPGRCQILSRRPWVLVDAAHTAASYRALEEVLGGLPPRERRFLVSVTPGKQARALAKLLHGARQVVVTRADRLRSAPAKDLARALLAIDPELAVRIEDDPGAALALAREGLSRDQLLCVCGSVYLAGFALERLGGGAGHAPQG